MSSEGIAEEASQVNINGIAHIQLSVSDMARSIPFYRRLLNFLSLTTLVESDDYFYCVGGRTGVAISPAQAGGNDSGFDQLKPGLHHVCFRAKATSMTTGNSR